MKPTILCLTVLLILFCSIRQKIYGLTYTSVDSILRIEAEHFDDIGDYIIEIRSGASNDTVLQAASSSIFSRATYQFDGSDGLCGIAVGYLDEGDGAGTFRLLVGEEVVYSWMADESSSDTYMIKEIPGITLTNGAQISIESIKQGGENGRIDYMELLIDSSEFILNRIYQAEEAISHNGTEVSDIYGYTGTGYITSLDSDTSEITFQVDVDSTQFYSITFRYLLNIPQNRPAVIHLSDENGSDSLVLDFYYTGGDGMWREQVITHSLDSGANQITLSAFSDLGIPDLDRIKLIPADVANQIPDNPMLMVPYDKDYTDSSFVMHWLGSEGAIQYSVYIGTENPPAESDFIATTNRTSYYISGLPDNTYYWNVKAENYAGSVLSTVRTFTVKNTFMTYYVATDGNDQDNGTLEEPFKTITKALSMVNPGDTIFIRGGVYNLSGTLQIANDGVTNKWINLFAYNSEIPIIECKSVSGRGILLPGSYIHMRGLTVQNAGDNGILISGSNNIIDRCITTGNKDTGIHLTDGASNNTIINCDSYRNYDPQNNGENADGFSAKFDVGPNNIFIGCRGYENSDDGWDFWEANEIIKLENCWAFDNGLNIWDDPAFSGDGNGFKMGGNYSTGAREVIFCAAFYNRKKGFDQNHNVGPITLINNTAYKNFDRNVVVYESPVQGTHLFMNNISYLASNNLDASATSVTNSWNGFTVTDDDFASLDTSGVRGQRQVDGSLPDLPFLHLAIGSLLVDAGTDTGYDFLGSAPDLGAFEGPRDPVINSIEDAYPALRKDLFSVYPNPFSDMIFIKYKLNHNSGITIKLYRSDGRIVKVLTEDQNFPEGEYSLNYSLHELTQGLYLIQFTTDNRVETKLIIKQ